MKNAPKISILIIAYNEEKIIDKCLKSIFRQNYPARKLEVILVDDFSSDNTIKVAKNYPVKVFQKDSGGDPEANKMYGFLKTSRDLFMYMDADIELVGTNWFRKMVKPLVEDEAITASFAKYVSDHDSPPIERYLNIDPVQRDPIYQYFSPDIDSTIVRISPGYVVCEYSKDNIVPQGMCLYRRKVIKELLKGSRFLELDLLVELVESGNDKYAYVESAGMIHRHVSGLGQLLKKRSRNVTKVYLKDNESRKYRWFDLKSFSGIAKVVTWVVVATLVFPLLALGVVKSIKHKTWVGMYEAPVGFLVTYVIIFSFLLDKRSMRLVIK